MIYQYLQWLALLVSLVFIVVQQTTIHSLKTQLVQSSSSHRSKRSTDDNSIYLPVFAQISKKAMKRMCKQHYQKRWQLMTSTLPSTSSTTEETHISTVPVRTEHKRKHCKAQLRLSTPRLVASRPNTVGGVSRDDNFWYVMEHTMGFGLLQFTSSKMLNISNPRRMIDLPYPFRGSNFPVHKKTVYFDYGNSLIAFNVKSGFTRKVPLPSFMQSDIYNNSNSYVQIIKDDHDLWIIYRQPITNVSSVTRMNTQHLKTVSTWNLDTVNTNNWCNSFVYCGILYSVTCESGVGATVRPVYDFYQNMYIKGKQMVWQGLENLQTVQYDSTSRSLNVFDSGNIYSIDVL